MKTNAAKLEPAIATLLGRLRRQIRSYVWYDGLAAAVVFVCMAFWAGLALDWSVEPPPAVRAIGLAVVGLLLAALIYRSIIRRLAVPLRDTSLALLLERHFRQFDESLVTTVELAEEKDRTDVFHPEMIEGARSKAACEAAGVDLKRVFRRKPLAMKMSVGAALLVSILVFAVVASDAMATWIDRGLLLSSAPWPRRARILVEGFEDGVVKIARGSDLQLVVNADTAKELIPESVRVRFVQEGAARQELMTRVGEADPANDPFQRFTYTFKSVLSPIEFDVRGGDDRISNLRIEPVDSPVIAQMTLRVEYPAYMRRGPRDEPVTGIMQIPVGASVNISGIANKDLAEVAVHRLQGDKTDLRGKVDMRAASNPTLLSFPVGEFDADQTLLLSLVDRDGIRSRDPVRLVLSAVPDEPPKLAVRLRSIGRAITPSAILPLAGEITDDYGVSRVWFEYAVGDSAVAQKVVVEADGGSQADFLTFDDEESHAALDIRDLAAQVGQRVAVTVKATDNYALAEEPNQAASETYSLEIVTAPQLLAVLEARELMLRRRLETVIELTTQARESLTGMQFDDAATPTAAQNGVDGPIATRQVLIRRAAADSQHSAQESLSLSDAFTSIHEELLNNRLDVTEKRTRLISGIAEPLKRIGQELLPELESRLEQLSSAAGDPRVGPRRLFETLEQCDTTLAALNGVLEQMLKLEDFNQLVEMLRGVIEMQDDLNAQTAKKHKEKARDLLE